MGEAAMLTRPEVRKLHLCAFAGGCPERSAELPQVHAIEVVPLAGLRHGFGARQPVHGSAELRTRRDHHVIHLVAA